jgi:hypothetical protein
MATDNLSTLPVDDNPMSPIENHIKILFENNKEDVGSITSEISDSLLAGILFVALSMDKPLEFMDNLVPSKLPVIKYCVRLMVFAIVFFIIKNLAFAKK